MIKVYIASPYTIGDVAVNVKRQLDCADELMTAGFAPFAPLYSHFQHMAHPRPYTDWIEIDLVWVEVCDCVLRLDGESKGADGEVNHALKLNKPIFHSLEELIKYYTYQKSNFNINGFPLTDMDEVKPIDGIPKPELLYFDNLNKAKNDT